MNTIAFPDIVKTIHNLPSLSAVVMELLSSIDRKNIDTDTFADMIARDQALSAKTLRLANSSFYGLQRKVATIQQAVSILGFNNIRSLITAAAVISRYPSSGHGAFDSQAFWRHSIATAVCAKALAKHIDVNQEYAFMAGLLHDIGRLVLITSFPQQYEAVLAYRTLHDCYLLEAEKTVLSLDHAAVGHALAEHWKFPEAMQIAISGHHTPEARSGTNLTNVLHVADGIVHALDLSLEEDELVPSVSMDAWNSLNMSREAMMQIFQETELQFKSVCEILVA